MINMIKYERMTYTGDVLCSRESIIDYTRQLLPGPNAFVLFLTVNDLTGQTSICSKKTQNNTTYIKKLKIHFFLCLLCQSCVQFDQKRQQLEDQTNQCPLWDTDIYLWHLCLASSSRSSSIVASWIRRSQPWPANTRRPLKCCTDQVQSDSRLGSFTWQCLPLVTLTNTFGIFGSLFQPDMTFDTGLTTSSIA